MKRYIGFVVLIILYLGTAYSQSNYIGYYQLINKAKTYEKAGQMDSSVISLNRAFELVDFIHIDNLKYAKKIARKENQQELYNHCVTSIKNSKDGFNLVLKEKLDSISKEDQRVRGSKFSKAKMYYYKCKMDTTFNCDKEKFEKSRILMEEWWQVDSSNVEYLKRIIKKYGFPGEKLVGKQTNDFVCIVLLHYDKDTANHIMGEALHKALIEGNIKPRMYAWIIDRHLYFAGKEQLYYSIPFGFEKLKNENRIIYNANRHSIGLKGLDEIKILQKGNSIRVTYKE